MEDLDGTRAAALARRQFALAAAPSGASKDQMVVRAEQVVARVNGVAISGRDLVGFDDKDGSARTMTPEMYRSLRERAIDRQLAFETAKARGVALDDAHKSQLAVVKKSLAQRAITDPAQVAFELRDAEGRMLMDALVARQGGPPAVAGPVEVERYYQDHAEEFDPLPDDPAARAAARARIDLEIRNTLSQKLSAEHANAVRDLMNRLRAGAAITAS